ncbi:thiol:disulfide interchange protein (plasmid) [Deinococcus grandis]|nr:thiol:disulfide interchange protein [Deinococcus grandis]
MVVVLEPHMTPFFSASPRPPLWRQLLPPLLAAGLVALLAATLLSPARNATDGGPLVGKSAPPLTLQTLDGSTISLVSLQGRPVILNFWASWCGPCREEAPLFRELSTRQTGQEGLVVLGVLYLEPSEQNARDFIREYSLAYPNLRDPGTRTGINYGVAGVPETFFISADGVVQHVDRGGLSRERLNIGLQKIGVPTL